MKIRVILRNGFPIPATKDAITVGTWIFIHPNMPPHLFKHEQVHVKQFKVQPFTFWLRYLLSKKWRMQYEAEAYAVSVANGLKRSVAVSLLTNGYSLHITAEQADREIKGYL